MNSKVIVAGGWSVDVSLLGRGSEGLKGAEGGSSGGGEERAIGVSVGVEQDISAVVLHSGRSVQEQ